MNGGPKNGPPYRHEVKAKTAFFSGPLSLWERVRVRAEAKLFGYSPSP
jgi:hypothetical protein